MKIITLVIELKIIKAATIPDILHLLGSEIEFLSEESGNFDKGCLATR